MYSAFCANLAAVRTASCLPACRNAMSLSVAGPREHKDKAIVCLCQACMVTSPPCLAILHSAAPPALSVGLLAPKRVLALQIEACPTTNTQSLDQHAPLSCQQDQVHCAPAPVSRHCCDSLDKVKAASSFESAFDDKSAEQRLF